MKRRIEHGGASILVGAISGYLCAFLISLECTAWYRVLYHDPAVTWALAVGYGARFPAILGALIGCVLLPVAYVTVLWRVPDGKLARAIGWMFVWVLVPSIATTAFQEMSALLGAVASIFISVFWLTGRYTSWFNRPAQPTPPMGG